MEVLKKAIKKILEKIVLEKNLPEETITKEKIELIFNIIKKKYETSLLLLDTCLKIEEKLSILVNLAQINEKNRFSKNGASCPLFFLKFFEKFLRLGKLLQFFFEFFYKDPSLISLEPKNFYNLSFPYFSKILGSQPKEIGFLDENSDNLLFEGMVKIVTFEVETTNQSFIKKVSVFEGKDFQNFPEKNSCFGVPIDEPSKNYSQHCTKLKHKAKFHLFKFKKKNRLIKKKLLLLEKRI